LLARYGVSPALLAEVESELNREGMSLGPLARPGRDAIRLRRVRRARGRKFAVSLDASTLFQIRRLAANGWSARKIAAQLVLSTNAVWRALARDRDHE
jgi:hypothetical protein